jgi:hypothetical protein
MGSWTRSSKGQKLTTISHSTVRKRKLKVRLLADCSIAIQRKRKGRPQSDKLLLPFGAPPRQVFNLVHITARDLYWIHFDSPKAFLRKTHRRRSLDAVEEQFKPVLNLIWKRRFELQALMGVMRCAECPECADLGNETEKEEDSRW